MRLPVDGRLLVLLDRIAPAAAFVGLLLLWEATVRLLAIPSFLLPAPSVVMQAMLATPLPV